MGKQFLMGWRTDFCRDEQAPRAGLNTNRRIINPMPRAAIQTYSESLRLHYYTSV
ncbi:hypothetical protein BN2497_8611 [Janthinobacterium sp. CG23_2]|nr:hypothetical protein BN2497_8611 [Janthinobacterium sp. CG23_2]CUU30703.1 hypothetical protein BN3177_8611 [Janthinobacterium sp. CG23_2]